MCGQPGNRMGAVPRRRSLVEIPELVVQTGLEPVALLVGTPAVLGRRPLPGTRPAHQGAAQRHRAGQRQEVRKEPRETVEPLVEGARPAPPGSGACRCRSEAPRSRVSPSATRFLSSPRVAEASAHVHSARIFLPHPGLPHMQTSDRCRSSSSSLAGTLASCSAPSSPAGWATAAAGASAVSPNTKQDHRRRRRPLRHRRPRIGEGALGQQGEARAQGQHREAEPDPVHERVQR